ncbi:unnamed protein product, partial [Nesidiocoris tenuis]
MTFPPDEGLTGFYSLLRAAASEDEVLGSRRCRTGGYPAADTGQTHQRRLVYSRL